MNKPTTVDMTTPAVAVRVREALLDNDFWTARYGELEDILEDLVEVITEAVTGEQPARPLDAREAPEPKLLREFPVRVNVGRDLTEYWARFEIQHQWIEIRTTVATHGRQVTPPTVCCYRIRNRLDVRMVGVDGTVYATQSRLLDGGW